MGKMKKAQEKFASEIEAASIDADPLNQGGEESIPESTDWKIRSMQQLTRKALAERGRRLDKFPTTVEEFNAGL